MVKKITLGCEEVEGAQVHKVQVVDHSGDVVEHWGKID